MLVVSCFECGFYFKFKSKPYLEQQVICAKCNTKFQVTNLDPIELDLVSEVPNILVKKKKNNLISSCPSCAHAIKLSQGVREGQQVICSKCKAQLEVASLTPLELELTDASRVKKLSKKHNRQKHLKYEEEFYDL